MFTGVGIGGRRAGWIARGEVHDDEDRLLATQRTSIRRSTTEEGSRIFAHAARIKKHLRNRRLLITEMDRGIL